MFTIVDEKALHGAADAREREFGLLVGLSILAGVAALNWIPPAAASAWLAFVIVMFVVEMRVFRWATTDVPRRSAGLALTVLGFAFSLGYQTLPLALLLQADATGQVVGVAILCACFQRNVPFLSISRPVGAASLIVCATVGVVGIAANPGSATAVERFIAVAAMVSCLVYALQAWWAHERSERALQRAEDAASLDREISMQMLAQPMVSVAVLDKELRFRSLSVRFCERMGIVAKDVIGRPMVEAMPWAPASWFEAQKRALTGERVRNEEDEYRRPDGSLAYAHWEVSPWRLPCGEVGGVVICGQDVTHNVAARKALEAQTERLQLVMRAGRSFVWDIDYRTGAVSGGEGMDRIYGREITLASLNPDNPEVFLPEDAPYIKAVFNRVTKGEIDSYEHRFIHGKTGEVHWVKLTFNVHRNAKGKPERLIVMSTDITDRKRRELSFLHAFEQAQAMLDARRALLGEISSSLGVDLPPEQVEVSAPVDRSSGTNFEELSARLLRLVYEIAARDGALSEAVQALKEARAAAESANQAKSQFLATMSHELRTPLNAIIGYTEIVLENAEDDGRSDDAADCRRVLGASRRLLSQINEVLDLAKIEAGRMELEVTAYDANALLADALETVQLVAQANGNRLEMTAGDGLKDCKGDAFKLGQCLINLLSNAAKFTKNGAISASAHRETRGNGDWIVFKVADTGIGMTKDQVDNLFQPFVQADSSTTRLFGGTGLGLAVTRRLARLLCGDVTAESTPGAGSVFTLWVPVRFGETTIEQVETPTSDQPFVLLVEDDLSAQDIVTRALSRVGLDVRSVTTMAMARHVLHTSTPALVLLDIELPDGEGWSLLEEMRALPQSPPAVVISVADDRARALSLGACDHYVKPVERDQLAAAVLRFARLPSFGPVHENAPSPVTEAPVISIRQSA